MKKIDLIILLLAINLLLILELAFCSFSEHYRISNIVFGKGLGDGSSSHYKVKYNLLYQTVGNFSSLNYKLRLGIDYVLDTYAPEYLDVTEPPDPSVYSPTASYGFSTRWTDNIAVDRVILQFDGVNYTDMTKKGHTYNKTFVGLSPGTYFYKWYANDTRNHWNSTELLDFTVLTFIEETITIEGKNYTITTESNTTITDVTATRNTLNFTTSGPTEKTAYINTTIPVGLNKTAISVFIDSEKLTPPPFPTITTNNTHYFIYFEFTQSIHNIIIQYAITDIAVTDVTPSKTVVGQGYTLNINITIQNHGSYIEYFDVSVFYNETAITLPDGKNHTTTTLTSGNSTTLTIPWNTTGVAKGNYTITAKATPLPDETDTLDNTLTDGIVLVTIPGDVNGNRHVFLYDAVAVCAKYGFKKGHPEYDPNCDIDNDGQIFLYDAVIVGAHYGQKDP